MRNDSPETDYDQVEYYMSVGANGNRSQPDDYVSSLLYQTFNEPRKTLVGLQILSFSLLGLFGCYAMMQTMGSTGLFWLAFQESVATTLIVAFVFCT
jgi:hypothetical protein